MPFLSFLNIRLGNISYPKITTSPIGGRGIYLPVCALHLRCIFSDSHSVSNFRFLLGTGGLSFHLVIPAFSWCLVESQPLPCVFSCVPLEQRLSCCICLAGTLCWRCLHIAGASSTRTELEQTNRWIRRGQTPRLNMLGGALCCGYDYGWVSVAVIVMNRRTDANLDHRRVRSAV